MSFYKRFDEEDEDEDKPNSRYFSSLENIFLYHILQLCTLITVLNIPLNSASLLSLTI